MASTPYPLARQALGLGDITGGLDAVVIKAVLVDTDDYTYSAAHQYLSDVAAGARVGTSSSIPGADVDEDGVFDADDASFAAVTGDSAEAVIVYVDTGAEGTSRLIAYIELASALTTDGSDVIVAWHASGICKL